MDPKSVDEIIKEIERIRKERQGRGDLFFDVVIEASKSIKERYGKWYEKAISELYNEIELMNELVPYEELVKLKSDLMKLKEKFDSNKKNLDRFVSSLEHGEIKSFAELELYASKRTGSFSDVLEALNIAKEVEEIEKRVENLSRFMTNVILLTKRLK
jgi:predicted RNA-binding protein with EMAP domain